MVLPMVLAWSTWVCLWCWRLFHGIVYGVGLFFIVLSMVAARFVIVLSIVLACYSSCCVLCVACCFSLFGLRALASFSCVGIASYLNPGVSNVSYVIFGLPSYLNPCLFPMLPLLLLLYIPT